MLEPIANNESPRTHIRTVEEWLNLELTAEDKEVILGSPDNPIVRPKTKNLIEAPEKCYKTTFTLRLMGGLSCGVTVYPPLPVGRRRKILYLHGELSDREIQERTRAAVCDLTGPFTEFSQGKVLDAHLIEKNGQRVMREHIEEYKPEDLVLDPLQSYIAGYDENSFKDMSIAEKFCDTLIEDYGVTLWIPIHQGKNHDRGARGHSSVSGWRDTRIALTRDASGLRVIVDPRWSQAPPAFRLRFEAGTLIPETREVFENQNGVLRSFVESHGGTATKVQLIEALGKGKDAGRKAIERAARAGAIVPANGHYMLPLSPDPGKKPN